MSKVLVADDEAAICQAFAQFLRLEGHAPLIAASGREALDLARRERPDAVFLDVRMPGLDVLETLARLRAEQPELPVIVMTAYGTMDTAMAAMRQGAFDYLGKPVDLAQLRALLRRALHRPQPPEPALAAPEPALRQTRNWPLSELEPRCTSRYSKMSPFTSGPSLRNSKPSSSSMTCLRTLGSTISNTASRKYSATSGSSRASEAM